MVATHTAPTATIPNTSAGPDALAPLMATGNVDFSYQSTAIETWLKSTRQLGQEGWQRPRS